LGGAVGQHRRDALARPLQGPGLRQRVPDRQPGRQRRAAAAGRHRWRLGLAAGEPRHDDLERQLAAAPAIAVPTITLEGDANGAPHADAGAYAGKFTGKSEHRLIEGGVGHNLPQEAPGAFAQAIIDADGY
jgi:pimeloyl-ACP methyl ester carboxylesterase